MITWTGQYEFCYRDYIAYNVNLKIFLISKTVFTCIYIHKYAGSTQGEQKRPSDFPGTGVIDGYKPPCGCSKPNLGPLGEQPVPLTTEASLRL